MKSISRTEEIWFLSGKRTAFGTFGGTVKDLSATDLAVESAKAAIAQAKVSPEDIQHVVYGNVVQTSPDAIYPLDTLDCALGYRCRSPHSVSIGCVLPGFKHLSVPLS